MFRVFIRNSFHYLAGTMYLQINFSSPDIQRKSMNQFYSVRKRNVKFHLRRYSFKFQIVTFELQI